MLSNEDDTAVTLFGSLGIELGEGEAALACLALRRCLGAFSGSSDELLLSRVSDMYVFEIPLADDAGRKIFGFVA